MNTLEFILKKYKLTMDDESPMMFYGTRWKYLPRLFRDVGFTVGAEIGVEEGTFSKRLCQVIPGLRLYSIDPWESYGYYAGRRHYSQDGMEKKYQKAVSTLSLFNCEIIRAFSHEAVDRFANGSLDFVHIDGNHDFDNVYRDIAIWIRKVRPGGIISGHDYYNSKDPKRCRAKDAVLRWTSETGMDPWFVIVGSRYPSYFWVVP